MRKIVTTVAVAVLSLVGATAYTGPARHGCDLVRTDDRPLCRQVAAQKPYGWITDADAIRTKPSGRALVATITGRHFTALVARKALSAEAASYRAHVSAVPADLRTLRSTDCWIETGYIDADGRPGGLKVQSSEQICP